MSDREIVKPEPSHKYFHQMLNIAEDELDPYEYRVLGHYIRWAGIGGAAREGIRQGSECCKMGMNTFRDARMRLVEKRYLVVTSPSDDEAKKGIATVIEVVDRWAENISRYSPVSDQIHPFEGKPVSDQIHPPVSDLDHSEEQDQEDKTRDLPPAAASPPKPTLRSFQAPPSKVSEGDEPALKGKRKRQQPELAQIVMQIYDKTHMSPENLASFQAECDLYDIDPLYKGWFDSICRPTLTFQIDGKIVRKKLVEVIELIQRHADLAQYRQNHSDPADTTATQETIDAQDWTSEIFPPEFPSAD